MHLISNTFLILKKILLLLVSLYLFFMSFKAVSDKMFKNIELIKNREDFINNHYDIDLEAKVEQDILLQTN